MPRKKDSGIRSMAALLERSQRKAEPEDFKTTTSVNLSASSLALLKRVAFARAMERRTRISVSEVLDELVREHAGELQAELKEGQP
jgi:hypothetical protein